MKNDINKYIKDNGLKILAIVVSISIAWGVSQTQISQIKVQAQENKNDINKLQDEVRNLPKKEYFDLRFELMETKFKLENANDKGEIIKLKSQVENLEKRLNSIN